MGVINVLDFQVANLIAAGEVVDRPASVVKELLENAIDAGANSITVEIKRGGVSFIRVTDNGCGMAKEDVPVSLKRHATSKIRDAADLDTIMTLGFRGEALAAISSVSQLRIMTKRREDKSGTVLESSGGRVTSIQDAGCPDGTTIIVENLFFNTPARLKFLKKDGTEATGVASYVEKIALSHPEITIRFISDGDLKYTTAGDGSRKSCIYAVLGREFTKKTIEIRGGFDGVDVTGFIGTPENIRGNRNQQIFYINNRFIRSKTVSAALEQAFATYIPSDKFPCAVLYLEMNPALVDVNVHPAKLEVKFSNERLVFESVYYAVRGALENRLDRPELKMLEKRAKEQSAKESIFAFAPGKEGRGGEKTQSVKDMRRTIDEGVTAPQKEPTAAAFADSEAFPAIKKTEEHPVTEAPIPAAPTSAFAGEQIPPPAEAPAPAEPTDSAIPPLPTEPPMSDDAVVSIPPLEIAKKKSAAAAAVPERVPEQKEIRKERTESAFSYMKIPPLPGKQQPREPEKVPEKQSEKTEEKQIPQYRMVGEVFQCYVILECGDTMYLVDKHAAHERILFEEFKACGRQSEQCSQMLLMPLEVSLTREEADAARDFADDIENSGFSFSIHGTTAEIDRIPAFLDTAQAMDAFCEACTRLAEHTGTAELTRELRYEKALFQASCKAAIKAGRNYDPAHLKWICDRVLSDPEIRYCPHGRPVCFEMTKAMVENRFGRT